MRKLLPVVLITALTACASPTPEPRLQDAHFLLLGEVHDNAAYIVGSEESQVGGPLSAAQ